MNSPKYFFLLYFLFLLLLCLIAFLTVGLPLVLLSSLLVIAAYFAICLHRDFNRHQASLREITHSLEMFSRGELSYRILPPSAEELSGLVRAINRVAAKVREQLSSLERLRSHHENMVESLREGIIVIEQSDATVRFMNKAAGLLLNEDPTEVCGAPVDQVLHHPSLLALVERMRCNDSAIVEDELTLQGTKETILHTYGGLLNEQEQERKVLILVLQDVTEIRRLEKVRREFIANVSHELKTPITSIKGSVETLLDGALSDRTDAERFIAMIGRQAERLNLIFDDMLTLSRVEQESEGKTIERVKVSISKVLGESAETCEQRAREKRVTVTLECDTEVMGLINPRLLQQAAVNLIDNAIKYSSEGGVVEVTAKRESEQLIVTVKDYGRGIAANHLPRLFERFYRVDSARDRKEGGTGLGLAIVKHIAQAHGGRVTVESTLGEGSLFSLFFPLLD